MYRVLNRGLIRWSLLAVAAKTAAQLVNAMPVTGYRAILQNWRDIPPGLLSALPSIPQVHETKKYPRLRQNTQ